MVARRVVLLFALLMLMSALAAQLAPERTRERDTSSGRGAVPGASAAGELIERTVSADASEPAVVDARVGDTLRLTVTSDEPISVELEQLDDIEAATPEFPAEFDVYADRPGTFAIVELESRRQIGRLEVQPAG